MHTDVSSSSPSAQGLLQPLSLCVCSLSASHSSREAPGSAVHHPVNPSMPVCVDRAFRTAGLCPHGEEACQLEGSAYVLMLLPVILQTSLISSYLVWAFAPTHFGTFVSYIRDAVKFFLHILHSDLVSLDLKAFFFFGFNCIRRVSLFVLQSSVGFGKRVKYPPLQPQIENSFNALKYSPTCFSYPTLFLLPRFLKVTDIFTVTIVLSLLKCHVNGIMLYVVFSDWLLSLSNIHLRFIRGSAWFDSSFPFIPLSRATTGRSSILLLWTLLLFSNYE